MRYTRKQKKEIAEYQGQRRNYRDDWSGRITKVVYLCKMCHSSKEYDLDDLEVDHIVPVSVGGPEILDNLQLLCPKHNKKKGPAISIKKGTLIRVTPRTAEKRGSTTKKKRSTAKRKTTTVRRKPSTTKKRPSTVKKKASTVKRKTKTAKRKTSAAKRKVTTVKRKTSSTKRKGSTARRRR